MDRVDERDERKDGSVTYLVPLTTSQSYYSSPNVFGIDLSS